MVAWAPIQLPLCALTARRNPREKHIAVAYRRRYIIVPAPFESRSLWCPWACSVCARAIFTVRGRRFFRKKGFAARARGSGFFLDHSQLLLSNQVLVEQPQGC